MDFTDHDYERISKLFSIDDLKTRRVIADMIFLFKIINGQVKCKIPAYLILVLYLRSAVNFL